MFVVSEEKHAIQVIIVKIILIRQYNIKCNYNLITWIENSAWTGLVNWVNRLLISTWWGQLNKQGTTQINEQIVAVMIMNTGLQKLRTFG